MELWGGGCEWRLSIGWYGGCDCRKAQCSLKRSIYLYDLHPPLTSVLTYVSYGHLSARFSVAQISGAILNNAFTY